MKRIDWDLIRTPLIDSRDRCRGRTRIVPPEIGEAADRLGDALDAVLATMQEAERLDGEFAELFDRPLRDQKEAP